MDLWIKRKHAQNVNDEQQSFIKNKIRRERQRDKTTNVKRPSQLINAILQSLRLNALSRPLFRWVHRRITDRTFDSSGSEHKEILVNF